MGGAHRHAADRVPTDVGGPLYHGPTMKFDEIESLRRISPAWRLLRANNAPLILGFLGRVFVDENVREISLPELEAQLDEELFALNERLGEDTFPGSARSYLDDWSAPDAGWLRKYYPPGSDEPHFDATPAVEKSVAWARSLGDRSFVGTESRLNTVFELLRQMIYGAETDPQARIAELVRRRHEIDNEIDAVKAGNFAVLDSAAQRDRYQQFNDTARALLSDFREVEANFRILDRQIREQIATWDGSKGELLDTMLGNRNLIADSDQGRSFQAFYDFLLSSSRQSELVDLLERLQDLDEAPVDRQLRYIHHDWLDAGERTQSTIRQLSEQLRRFLDDKVWLENRRVMDLLRSIESNALRVRDAPPTGSIAEIDATAPEIALPMERPLYSRSVTAPIDSTGITDATADHDDSALFDQTYVDPEPLVRAVRKSLQRHSQTSLRSIIEGTPMQHGLAELVTYLSLRDDSFAIVFDETHSDEIDWVDDDGTTRIATLPRVTFARTTGGA